MALAQSSAAQKPNRKQRRQAERRARRDGRRDSIESRLRDAFEQHRAGRFGEAEALYRQVLGEHPEELLSLSRLGALCAQTGRLDEARALLERALTIDPGHAASHMNLGFVHAQQGRTAEADAAFRAGARHDPNDPDTQKNYGAWCQQQGRLDEAVTALKAGLARAPDDPRRRNSLALALAGLGRLDEAAAQFERALAQSDDPEIHANYGVLLAHRDRPDEALGHMARGFERPGTSPDYQVLFASVVEQARPRGPVPALDRAFLACFAGEATNWQKLAPAVGTHLWTKYMERARVERAEDGRASTVHLDGILADPLLLALLRKAVSINIGLEALLVPLRRRLLAMVSAAPRDLEAALGFMAAFAMQCHNNAYVFPVSEQEQAAVATLAEALARDIAGLERPDAAFEARLSLLAMYRPLHELAGFERLLALPQEAWSESLRPLIALSLAEPAEEQRLKPTIESFGEIADRVSQAVRSQYEENPYPRWVALPRQAPATFSEHIGQALPGIAPPQWQEDGLPCLIAGCGTGRHPVAFATRLPRAAVTAVDLSLSSLAYAKRMAGRYGLENLEFRHGDLRQIGALGRRFKVIECSGVLHHLERPEEGLRSLLGVLAPDGYLRLGLYSRTARQAINVSRERVRALGLAPTADAIREYRRRLIAREEPGLEQFVTLTDFFDLDSFRDLVFHVQEHQYDIPELDALLRRNGLELLGFCNLKPIHARGFAARFPAPDAVRDPAAWAAYEADNPDCFLGMYEFWCRRMADHPERARSA